MSSDNYIRKQFQEKFNDFKGEVPPDGWQRLEKALNEAVPVVLTPRRRWRYAVASAVAVLLLIVGSVLFIQRPWEQPDSLVAETTATDRTIDRLDETKMESVSVETEVLAPSEGGTEASLGAIPESPSKTSRDVGLGSKVKAGAALKMPPSRVLNEVHIASGPTEVANVQLAIGKKVEEAITRMHAAVSKHNSVLSLESSNRSEEEEVLTVEDKWDRLLMEGMRRRENDEPLLLAMGGRGGLHSYQQVVNRPMTLRSTPADNEMGEEVPIPLYATQKVADNVSEMEHNQPLSFGITLSKEIIDGLSIESGLVYSYLLSKVRNESSSLDAYETQHLHYIGLPLSLNYTVFSLNKLNLYASVGGMIEKDVYGNFKQLSEEEIIGNSQSLKREVVKISQRNPQLSLNVGVGLSYPLYNRLRLYGKIGGAYYFNAENEHKTIYSDQKIVLDLNVGLKFEF